MNCLDIIRVLELSSKFVLAGALFWLGWRQLKLKEKTRNDELFDRRFDYIKRFQNFIRELEGFYINSQNDKSQLIDIVTVEGRGILNEFKLLFSEELYLKTFPGIDNLTDSFLGCDHIMGIDEYSELLNNYYQAFNYYESMKIMIEITSIKS